MLTMDFTSLYTPLYIKKNFMGLLCCYQNENINEVRCNSAMHSTSVNYKREGDTLYFCFTTFKISLSYRTFLVKMGPKKQLSLVVGCLSMIYSNNGC